MLQLRNEFSKNAVIPFCISISKHVFTTVADRAGFLLMSTEAKTAQVNLRLQPSLKVKAAAEKAAVDEQRSLTNLIEKLLTDYLRAKGYLKPAKK
jgi:hypothetical protein